MNDLYEQLKNMKNNSETTLLNYPADECQLFFFL